MKKKPEQPAPADGDLFQQAMEGVTPIIYSRRISTAPPARRVTSSRNQSAQTPVIADSWSDHGANEVAPTTFLRSGLNNMTLRKLRRGQWPVQDSIDLHGSTSEEARRLLAVFLIDALQNGLRSVNVIHGKGWRAEGGEGILKIRVRHWLTQHPQVLAFCEAPPSAGGGGAVWVLLKSTGQGVK